MKSVKKNANNKEMCVKQAQEPKLAQKEEERQKHVMEKKLKKEKSGQ